MPHLQMSWVYIPFPNQKVCVQTRWRVYQVQKKKEIKITVGLNFFNLIVLFKRCQISSRGFLHFPRKKIEVSQKPPVGTSFVCLALGSRMGRIPEWPPQDSNPSPRLKDDKVALLVPSVLLAQMVPGGQPYRP